MTAAADDGRRRLRRAPHVLCLWAGTGRVVQSARRPSGVPATDLVLEVLDHLDTWTAIDTLAEALALPVAALAVLVDGLQAHDLIETDAEGGPHTASSPGARSGPWAAWSPAASFFHAATRDVAFGRGGASGTDNAGPRPDPVLPPRGASILPLPAPCLEEQTLQAALRDRRTHRRFGPGPIALADLATLLGVTFGVQAWAQAGEGPLALKTSPSGGARHSLEAYVWARHVDGLAPGPYHYRPGDHTLSTIDQAVAPDAVTRWLPTQHGYEEAAVIVVLASELARVAWRYRSARAYRVILIEAGHLAQSFCLVATALGLAPFCTAALAETAIETDLGLDGQAQPAMYVMGVGQVASGPWQPHAGRPAPRLDVTALGRGLIGDET